MCAASRQLLLFTHACLLSCVCCARYETASGIEGCRYHLQASQSNGKTPATSAKKPAAALKVQKRPAENGTAPAKKKVKREKVCSLLHASSTLWLPQADRDLHETTLNHKLCICRCPAPWVLQSLPGVCRKCFPVRFESSCLGSTEESHHTAADGLVCPLKAQSLIFFGDL